MPDGPDASAPDPGRLAVVVPAKDESQRIAATVRAARELPEVSLVVVVDDGSSDDTAARAEEAGAVVVRHQRNRGKAAAMESGAARVARLDAETGRPPRALLFVDADLGATALSITHDMHSARKIASRIAMLHGGRIIWNGAVTEIDRSGNAYVEQFIHGRAEGPIQMQVRA